MNNNIKDISRLLIKNFTFFRITNALKVYLSYTVSKLLKKPIQWGMPISFSIEPTTSCNLRCPQCPSGLRSFTRPTGMLNSTVYEKAIKELSITSGYITFYFQGEPYLNKNFIDMVTFASQHKMYSATSTNAHYLTIENAEATVKSGLDRLIISIDGSTQDTYEKYRIGGQLEKVLSGTKNIMDAKKRLKSSTPHVIWQFIVFSHNEHQIDEVKTLAKELKINELSIKTAQIYDFENGSEIMPQNENLRRYEEVDGKFKIKNKLLNHCWRLWSACVITWDGKIVPCCFDKDGTYQLGNINNQSFKNIWWSKPYHLFRNQLLKGREHIDICKNCSEGSSVWK